MKSKGQPTLSQTKASDSSASERTIWRHNDVTINDQKKRILQSRSTKYSIALYGRKNASDLYFLQAQDLIIERSNFVLIWQTLDSVATQKLRLAFCGHCLWLSWPARLISSYLKFCDQDGRDRHNEKWRMILKVTLVIIFCVFFAPCLVRQLLNTLFHLLDCLHNACNHTIQISYLLDRASLV